jgi:SAM-dependent methyltransferase
MELLIGCGGQRDKKLAIDGKNNWEKLVTLDMNKDHNPDVVWDVTKRPLPFDDNTFDEIHAYDVLEHLGQQGDYKAWFAEWEEWYRILKPGGFMAAISPKWDTLWAWGDPGHTRVINRGSMIYLDQEEYTQQIGKTAMTDYRFCYRSDFGLVLFEDCNDMQFAYVLQAVKPSRCTL